MLFQTLASLAVLVQRNVPSDVFPSRMASTRLTRTSALTAELAQQPAPLRLLQLNNLIGITKIRLHFDAVFFFFSIYLPLFSLFTLFQRTYSVHVTFLLAHPQKLFACGTLFSAAFRFCLFFYALTKCKVCSMLLFCLPRKVTKRVHSRTTFLRISLTCRFKRAAARVRVGMLLHLTWYALQIARRSRSTLTTWLYCSLGRVRGVSHLAQILAVRKI